MGYNIESKMKFVSENYSECGNTLTIFCIMPIESKSDISISSESKNTFKRFCPKCEYIWPL